MKYRDIDPVGVMKAILLIGTLLAFLIGGISGACNKTSKPKPTNHRSTRAR